MSSSFVKKQLQMPQKIKAVATAKGLVVDANALLSQIAKRVFLLTDLQCHLLYNWWAVFQQMGYILLQSTH
jgi:hypothetical protein